MSNRKGYKWLRPGLLVLVLVQLLLISGCGGDSMHALRGVVTHQGQPLSDATVVFHPVESSAGNLASGKTDQAGRFELSSFGTEDGIRAGTYRVTVTVSDPGLSDPTVDLRQAIAEAEKREQESEASAVHKNYQSVGKTPIEISVPVNGAVRLELNSSGT